MKAGQDLNLWRSTSPNQTKTPPEEVTAIPSKEAPFPKNQNLLLLADPKGVPSFHNMIFLPGRSLKVTIECAARVTTTLCVEGEEIEKKVLNAIPGILIPGRTIDVDVLALPIGLPPTARESQTRRNPTLFALFFVLMKSNNDVVHSGFRNFW